MSSGLIGPINDTLEVNYKNWWQKNLKLESIFLLKIYFKVKAIVRLFGTPECIDMAINKMLRSQLATALFLPDPILLKNILCQIDFLKYVNYFKTLIFPKFSNDKFHRCFLTGMQPCFFQCANLSTTKLSKKTRTLNNKAFIGAVRNNFSFSLSSRSTFLGTRGLVTQALRSTLENFIKESFQSGSQKPLWKLTTKAPNNGKFSKKNTSFPGSSSW